MLVGKVLLEVFVSFSRIFYSDFSFVDKDFGQRAHGV